MGLGKKLNPCAGEELRPLFSPVSNNATLDEAITADGVYRMIRDYAEKAGIKNLARAAHAMRATAATNALDRGADIAKVQEWLGHANIFHHARVRSPPYAPGG